ncbi:hypothetical protein SBOR_9333 [Sclerotinia borealis F-4128]|uniref:Uncharacterized protein n=1 Tax=Sclerotinia borealis (strain F-4128) TaxID=1432307 RepID=W9C3I4_SCLBF|nr:hypothetical protein SBOR_9333 [Sclerotinia borealis F-4128]
MSAPSFTCPKGNKRLIFSSSTSHPASQSIDKILQEFKDLWTNATPSQQKDNSFIKEAMNEFLKDVEMSKQYEDALVDRFPLMTWKLKGFQEVKKRVYNLEGEQGPAYASFLEIASGDGSDVGYEKSGGGGGDGDRELVGPKPALKKGYRRFLDDFDDDDERPSRGYQASQPPEGQQQSQQPQQIEQSGNQQRGSRRRRPRLLFRRRARREG